MTIQELQKYYQNSWFAWLFFPRNLGIALGKPRNSQYLSEWSLKNDSAVCFEFETFLNQMSFFTRWLFENVITAFTEGETYKKYLLVPEGERHQGNRFFPLLQSISGYENAQKTYTIISQLSHNNGTIKNSLYAYGLFRSGADEFNRGVPQLFLNLEKVPNTPSLTLDFTNNRDSDIKDVFSDLLKLVKSKHCPSDLMIKFPLTLSDEVARLLYQAVPRHAHSGICIMMGASVLPMNQITVEEMLEQKEMIVIKSEPVIEPYFFLFDSKRPKLMDRLYSAVLMGKATAVKLFVKESVASLNADDRLTKDRVSGMVERAIKSGHLNIVNYLTTLGGDLQFNQDDLGFFLQLSATYTQHPEITQYFVSMPSDNIPTKTEYVNKALDRAVNISCIPYSQWSSVPLLLSIEGDSKPDKAIVSNVLTRAAYEEKWDIVKLVLNMNGENKPDENAVTIALSEATKAGKLDELVPSSIFSDSQRFNGGNHG